MNFTDPLVFALTDHVTPSPLASVHCIISEKRRVSVPSDGNANSISIDALKSLSVRLFPALNDKADVHFTYLDPEDNSVITMRLDEDLHECVRLFSSAATLNLEVVAAPDASAGAPAAAAQASASEGHVHTNVTCDNCGMAPIVGPRFKCLVRDDFDLCPSCETESVQPYAMVKIYSPEQAPAALLVGLKDSESPTEGPAHWEAQPPLVAGSATGMGRRGHQGWGHGRQGRGFGFGMGGFMGPPRGHPHGHGPHGPLRSRWGMMHGPPSSHPPHAPPHDAHPHPQGRFVRDETFPDGSAVDKDTDFTKSWVVRNDGSAEWPQGSSLKFVSGDEMTIELPININCPPGGEVVISVKLKTPPMTGRFVSYFRLAGPAGSFFGQRLWCDVRSVDSSEPPQPAPASGSGSEVPDAAQQGEGPFARELALLRELGFTNLEQLLPLLRDLIGTNGLTSGNPNVEVRPFRIGPLLLLILAPSNPHLAPTMLSLAPSCY